MINKRIEDLRELMRRDNIDYYIIPSSDPHQSEYVAERFKARAWISGFSGSAGTVIVTREKAFLWTDGRYHIQAAKEIEGTELILIKYGLADVPNPWDWLKKEALADSCIGFDGNTIPYHIYNDMYCSLKDKGITFNYDKDLVDEIWTDRPELPNSKAFILEDKYAGLSRVDKIKQIRSIMKEKDSSAYILPSLDDICWTLNIRGEDIAYSPVVLSYLIVTMDNVDLYIDASKFSSDDLDILVRDGININKYKDIINGVKNVESTSVIYPKSYTSTSIVKALKDDVKTRDDGDIAERLKAVKNDIEIENLIKCQEVDGVAMVRFIKWLEENKGNNINEVDVADKLRELRGEHPLNRGQSFATIAAYDANAAMMHYHPTKENCSVIDEEGYLLVDSGGQYLIGTTDITRTFPVGELDEERRVDYTLTLRSHIGLAQAIFLRGATGPSLDILARKPMWDRGMDYKCGTGHGVGFFLNVHEGPHTIRKGTNAVELEKGMIITNEPGVYKIDKYGIRIENTVVVEDAFTTSDGEFYRFKTISYCPIDTRPIIKEMMSSDEVQWLNQYHDEVYKRLSPMLDSDEVDFLKEITRPI